MATAMRSHSCESEQSDSRRNQLDKKALDRLVVELYEELQGIAHGYLVGESRKGTLQTATLIHEAYLRLTEYRKVDVVDQHHFLMLAAQAMRRILVDSARMRKSAKRGGDQTRITLTEALAATGNSSVDLLAVEAALQQLESLDPRRARVVELRFYGGLTVEQTATIMETSPATIKREWRAARSWLQRIMTSPDDDASS